MPVEITRRAAVAFAAALCAPFARAQASDSTLAQIKQRGFLRVGVTQAPPWFSQEPKTGEWTTCVGVSLGKAMASALNVKFEPVEVTWGTAIAALQGNKIDVMYMMDATPERHGSTTPMAGPVSQDATCSSPPASSRNRPPPARLPSSRFTPRSAAT